MRYALLYDLCMGIATAEVRARAIAAYEAGNGTQAEIAKFYRVDISTFQRWLQRYRTTGRASPLPRGHNPPSLDETQMQRLCTLIESQPDATLEQLREALGVSCTLATIHNSSRRLGYRLKKNAAGQRTRAPGH